VDIDQIGEGMTVHSADGKRVGKIIRRDGDDLVIEKGLFSKKEYVASLDDVARVEQGQVWLRQSAAELEGAPPEDEAPPRASGEPEPSDADRLSAAGEDDEEILVLLEDDLVLELPPDGPPAFHAPGRTPSGRH
jgi:hypothetical protein